MLADTAVEMSIKTYNFWKLELLDCSPTRQALLTYPGLAALNEPVPRPAIDFSSIAGGSGYLGLPDDHASRIVYARCDSTWSPQAPA